MSRLAQVSVALSAILFTAGTLAAQPAAQRSYDLAYIGPPLADPVMQQSKETYVSFGCAYCHGVNLEPRGEATDLRVSGLVAKDVDGDQLGPVLREGIPQTPMLSPMPSYGDLSDRQIGDLMRWMHYARGRANLAELSRPATAAGNASAGKAYFDRSCVSCHSLDKDLSAAGKKYDAAALRGQILEPKTLSAAPSYTVDALKDTRILAGRRRHGSLLENYSAEDIANLVAYLQQGR